MRSRARGFTLLELLAAVAIGAVVASATFHVLARLAGTPDPTDRTRSPYHAQARALILRDLAASVRYRFVDDVLHLETTRSIGSDASIRHAGARVGYHTVPTPDGPWLARSEEGGANILVRSGTISWNIRLAEDPDAPDDAPDTPHADQWRLMDDVTITPVFDHDAEERK